MVLTRTIKLSAALFLALAPACNTPLGREVPAEIPGWIRNGNAPAEYVMGIDHAVVRSGGGAAFLEATSAPQEHFGSLAQTVAAGRFAGKRVRLAASVRGEGVTTWAGLWMNVNGADGRTLAGDNMQDRALRGTTDWTPLEVVLDVPAGAESIAFGALLEGSGTVWVDDVSLEAVDASVPVTKARIREWFPTGSAAADYEMGEDPVPTRSGATSTAFLRSRPTAQATGYGSWMHGMVSARAWKGKRIRLQGWIESADVTGGAGLWVRADDAGHKTLLLENMEDRKITGSHPWTSYEVVLDVPANAHGIAYGALLQGSGALRLSDLRIEEVEGSPPPRTALPLLPGGYTLAGSAIDAFEASGDPGAPRGAGAVLRSRVAEPGGFGTLDKSVDAAPFRGTKIRLSGQVKTTEVRGWAGLWARVDGPDGKPVAFDNMQGRALRGTVDWARYEVVLDVPPDATKIAFGALLSGAGRVEVGDLSLTAAPGAAEATDLVQRRSAPPDAPRNLGFDE